MLRLLTLLDELKSARIGVEQLGETARQTGGQLAVKLEELALLQESLETVCASIGEDANDQLMLLDQQLQEHPYIVGREVFLWGFSDLTAIEMEILHTILEQADNVTVALLTDGYHRRAFFRGNRNPAAAAADGRRGLPYCAPGRYGLPAGRPTASDGSSVRWCCQSVGKCSPHTAAAWFQQRIWSLYGRGRTGARLGPPGLALPGYGHLLYGHDCLSAGAGGCVRPVSDSALCVRYRCYGEQSCGWHGPERFGMPPQAEWRRRMFCNSSNPVCPP